MYTRLKVLHRHVLQSNEIEHIRVRGGPLFQSHIAAALWVTRQAYFCAPAHPYEIHRRLGMGTDLASHAGAARTCRIWVGDHECPKPEHVPFLMQWWEGLVQEYVCKDFGSEVAEVAHLLHDLLLCIHPFEDGNGRTARLVLNSLRLEHGLPWHIVEARYRHSYYRRIVAIEQQVFKAHFPDVYN